MDTPIPASATAQPTPKVRSCATMQVHERLLRTDADYARMRIVSENHHFAFRSQRGAFGRSGVTVIPVVVHVVQKNAVQNISDAQIKSQIDVLNRDFRKLNSDIGSVPAPFAPLAADARIEFVLADKDPAGNASSGITRTPTQSNGFIDDDKVKAAATGGADAWPRDKYLNIWVCQLSGGLLGYAQFPGGAAATDGVVILHSAFGTQGSAAAPFNLGRTATHEIGHWLNLRHIWGDDGGGCNGDDFISDTPNQADANPGKPAFPHVTCNNGPNGDMFMNYMDYVDDDTMFMFSAGQVGRMQACLDGDRTSIGTQKPTLAVLDQTGPTLKFRDDPVTFKFRDDPTTLKFRDDPITFKFRDDGGTFTKFFDDVKNPVFDKPPQLDQLTGAGFDAPGFPGFPGGPGPGPGPLGQRGGGVPFVLSTPHHSMAWTQSFPQAAQNEVQALAQQIGECEAMLGQYAQAEAAGQLTQAEHSEALALQQSYEAMVAEYQRYVSG